MRFASAVSTFTNAQDAVRNTVVSLRDELGSESVDLVVVFATAHYEDDFEAFSGYLTEVWPNALLVGCTAGGVIGEGREIEESAAVTLFAGNMPGATLQGFYLDQATLETAEQDDVLLRSIGVRRVSSPGIILLGDPFSIQISRLLERLTQSFDGAPIVGGMASGGEKPGQNALLVNREVYRDGAVGVVLSGNVHVGTVVSQGCRPIGRSFVITRADRNVILDLGGKPALEMLRKTFATLSSEDRSLAQSALFIGVVIDEYKGGFRQGDFLIRNLMGWDPKSGAIAIADVARVGTTVQFHVRDAASADKDIRQRLQVYVDSCANVQGALLFSCNGRGRRMWDEPNHDVSCLLDMVGEIPTGGFFCAGELGPVGEQNFIHGHTASIALLSPRDSQEEPDTVSA